MKFTLPRVRFEIKPRYFQETKISKQVKDGLKSTSEEIE